MKSDHVAQVHDVGVLADGTRYLVMEYLDGRDLAHEMEERGRLSVGQSCAVALQVLDAVGRAHEAGIVHRDLKPENIFLVRQVDGTRRIKVVDFGISKLEDTTNSLKLTGTSDLMGTPLYMSPEQMATPDAVDGRADIWSIGCVLYEMLVGRVPFEGQTIPEICMLVLGSEPLHISDVAPDVPRQLGDIVMTCLAKEPGERFTSAFDLAELLEPFVMGPSAPSESWIPGRVTGVSRVPSVDIPSMVPVSHARAISARGGEVSTHPTLMGVPQKTLITETPSLPVGAETGEGEELDLTETIGEIGFKKKSRAPLLLFGIVVSLALGGAIAWSQGVLPKDLRERLSSPHSVELAPEVGATQEAPSLRQIDADALAPKSGASQPQTSGAEGSEEIRQDVIGSTDGAVSVRKQMGKPGAFRAKASPAQAAPPASIDTTSASAPSPSRTTKKSVAAPYDEFAEFGGRR